MDKPFEVDFEQIVDQPIYSLLMDGKSYEAYVYPADKAWQVLLYGRSYPALVEQEMERRLRMASGGGVSEKAEYPLEIAHAGSGGRRAGGGRAAGREGRRAGGPGVDEDAERAEMRPAPVW